MAPPHLYRLDIDLFIRGVNASQCRSERNHVHVRVFLQEQATLQSGMDRPYDRFFTELLPRENLDSGPNPGILHHAQPWLLPA